MNIGFIDDSQYTPDHPKIGDFAMLRTNLSVPADICSNIAARASIHPPCVLVLACIRPGLHPTLVSDRIDRTQCKIYHNLTFPQI